MQTGTCMTCDQRTGKYLILCGAKIMTPIRDVFFLGKAKICGVKLE